MLFSMTDSGSKSPKKKIVKSTHTTAQAKQTNRTAQKQKEEQNKKVFKHAMIRYAREKSKKGGKLAESVVTHVNKEFNVNLSTRSVQRFVQEGKIGISPQKWGPKGNIPEHHYQNLCKAVESFVSIQNIKGTNHECLYKKLGQRLKNAMYGDQELPHNTGRALLRRVLADVAINLNSLKTQSAEDR